MKLVQLISLLSISFAVVAAENSALSSVSQLQWSNRVLLIFGDKDYMPQLNAQLDEINERHIKWFLFDNEGVQSNHAEGVTKEFLNNARSRYMAEGAGVVLIGKDGGVKGQQSELDLSIIFATIDSMPMRLEEMQQEHKSS